MSVCFQRHHVHVSLGDLFLFYFFFRHVYITYDDITRKKMDLMTGLFLINGFKS